MCGQQRLGGFPPACLSVAVSPLEWVSCVSTPYAKHTGDSGLHRNTIMRPEASGHAACSTACDAGCCASGPTEQLCTNVHRDARCCQTLESGVVDPLHRLDPLSVFWPAGVQGGPSSNTAHPAQPPLESRMAHAHVSASSKELIGRPRHGTFIVADTTEWLVKTGADSF